MSYGGVGVSGFLTRFVTQSERPTKRARQARRQAYASATREGTEKDAIASAIIAATGGRPQAITVGKAGTHALASQITDFKKKCLAAPFPRGNGRLLEGVSQSREPSAAEGIGEARVVSSLEASALVREGRILVADVLRAQHQRNIANPREGDGEIEYRPRAHPPVECGTVRKSKLASV